MINFLNPPQYRILLIGVILPIRKMRVVVTVHKAKAVPPNLKIGLLDAGNTSIGSRHPLDMAERYPGGRRKLGLIPSRAPESGISVACLLGRSN